MPLVHFSHYAPPPNEVDETFLNAPGQTRLLYRTKPIASGDDWYGDALEAGSAAVVAPEDGRLKKPQETRPETLAAAPEEIDPRLAKRDLAALAKMLLWLFVGTVLLIPMLYLLLTSLLFRNVSELPDEITSVHVHGSLHPGILLAGQPLSQIRALDWSHCAELCEVLPSLTTLIQQSRHLLNPRPEPTPQVASHLTLACMHARNTHGPQSLVANTPPAAVVLFASIGRQPLLHVELGRLPGCHHEAV